MPRKSHAGRWSWLLLPGAVICGWYFIPGLHEEKSVVISNPQTTPNLSQPATKVRPAAPRISIIAPLKKPEAPARSREWLVKSRSAAELKAFLEHVRQLGGRVLAVIPRLGAARIAFDTEAQGQAIRDALPETATSGLNYLVNAPMPPDPQTDTGGPYLGFGREALDWLGVPAENGDWGRGVKVAVLDTGIYAVPGLTLSSIRQIDLVGSSSGGEMQDHGTAVASIIGGSSADERGVAPGAELMSIRVLDNSGTGDSFTVAQGIIDAVDNGARVISMSIASAGDSQVMRDAVTYALSRNVAVVAAVGNEGVGAVSYPAAYSGVIAVTAVDANGQRGGFANYGDAVTIAAPGIGVVTPWIKDQEVNFSGTSAAVPFVSGTLAMLMSANSNLTPTQARQLLVDNSDDAGAPGQDPFFGSGILDIKRVLARNQPGINDAAAADFYRDPQANGASKNQVEVTVQNRGTTTLSSVTLEVDNGGQLERFNLNSLAVGQVQSRSIEVDPAALAGENGVLLRSRVLVNGVQDINSKNDSRAVRLRIKRP